MSEINFRTAEFLISAPSINECPSENGTEVAFAGRSNAGKSSAINALTDNQKLAKTSKTPGRTQLINFFSLNHTQELRLVDLPGYGYAKVPLETKKKWQKHLAEYLEKRHSLKGLVLLSDIRHPLQEFDSLMLNWALGANMPVHMLLTKSDKLKRGPMNATLLQVQKHIRELDASDRVTVQTFSAMKKQGIGELTKTLSRWLLSS